MIGDIRMNIGLEKERAKNCIFISFMQARNERIRVDRADISAVIDGKFAKLLCNTQPTLTPPTFVDTDAT